jgi:hypothetical protein
MNNEAWHILGLGTGLLIALVVCSILRQLWLKEPMPRAPFKTIELPLPNDPLMRSLFHYQHTD